MFIVKAQIGINLIIKCMVGELVNRSNNNKETTTT